MKTTFQILAGCLVLFFLSACEGGAGNPAVAADMQIATESVATLENTPVAAEPSATATSIVSLTGMQRISTDNASQIKLQTTFTGHTSRVFGVAFSSDGLRLVSNSQDGTIRLWDLSTLAESTVINQRSGEKIAFLAGDRQVGLGNGVIVDVETGEVIHALNSGIDHACYSPDGQWMAAMRTGGPMEIWNLTTWELAHSIDVQNDTLIGMAFSPDGRFVATGPSSGPDDTSDYIVRIWNVSDGSQVMALNGHRSDIHTIAFSPDGSLLATGSIDETIRIWDLETGRTVHTLRYGNGVNGLQFSPDGTLLASAGSDGRVKLWDVESGSLLKTLSHPDELLTVAFSPDGTILASGGYDNVVYLWGISQ